MAYQKYLKRREHLTFGQINETFKLETGLLHWKYWTCFKEKLMESHIKFLLEQLGLQDRPEHVLLSLLLSWTTRKIRSPNHGDF
jgi:hypothetical protein